MMLFGACSQKDDRTHAHTRHRRDEGVSVWETVMLRSSTVNAGMTGL